MWGKCGDLFIVLSLGLHVRRKHGNKSQKPDMLEETFASFRH
jgi:hypothetical protein